MSVGESVSECVGMADAVHVGICMGEVVGESVCEGEVTCMR